MARQQRVEHVGIRGLYIYFPKMMVQQQDLEAADGCPGKYTVGLGQQAMTFCGDREDVVSMAATAVLQLLEGSGVKLTDIGRIEVGTETGVDRSKSVMSYLVAYFNEAGNYTVQGADHMHGCYGGTSALFTVADWVASPSWDGRLGLVVATDIAVYPPGSPARPTCGCGAAAMLIGPDAPLVIEPWPWRASFSAHTYDFFKPHGHPLYPVVDGPATLLWFTKAADACAAQLYTQLQQHGLLAAHQQGSSGSGSGCSRSNQQQQQQQQGSSGCGGDGSKSNQQQQQQQQQREREPGLLSSFDYFVSHSPYNKIVRKVFARLVLHDGLRARQYNHKQQDAQQPQQPQKGGGLGQQQQQEQQQQQHGISQHLQQSLALNGTSRPTSQQQGPASSSSSAATRGRPATAAAEAAGLDLAAGPLPDSSIQDKQLEKALVQASAGLYEAMGSPAAQLQRQLGNLYTASLYSGVASLLCQQGQQLGRKRLLCFSFGSGAVASMFTLTGRGTTVNSSDISSSCSTRDISEAAVPKEGQQQPETAPEGQQQPYGKQQQQQQQQLHPQHQLLLHSSWHDALTSLQRMADQLQLVQRLSARQPFSVADFDAAMVTLRAAYNSSPYSPTYGVVDDLQPGTVHLVGIDGSFRRNYNRRPL